MRLTGSKSQIVYRPLPEDDPKVRQPDITRARTLLGWEPKVPLEEGLRKTLRVLPLEDLTRLSAASRPASDSARPRRA